MHQCQAKSEFQNVVSRCKNHSRLRLPDGRYLCSRHAGLIAIDLAIKAGKMEYIEQKNLDLFKGFFHEVVTND